MVSIFCLLLLQVLVFLLGVAKYLMSFLQKEKVDVFIK